MSKENLFSLKTDQRKFIYDGFYRAKVIDNKDPQKFGRVKVFIPDIMFDSSLSGEDTISGNDGIWALPACNPIGGRNIIEGDNTIKDQGTCYIPYENTWVWIFFEKGNPNRPFYIASFDNMNREVPLENQVGKEYWNKQTLMRSKAGRVIIVSDDPFDERVEITGKKRLYDPNNDDNSNSIFTIIDNQTTILLDERDGKEKLLIKDYKGNYINLKQTDNSLNIFLLGKLLSYIIDDIEFTTDGNVTIKIKGNLNIKVDGNVMWDINGRESHKTGDRVDFLSGGIHAVDAPMIYHNSGVSSPLPYPREPLKPDGNRDMGSVEIKITINNFNSLSNIYMDDYTSKQIDISKYNLMKNKTKDAINNYPSDGDNKYVKEVLNIVKDNFDEIFNNAINNKKSKLIPVQLNDNNYPMNAYKTHNNDNVLLNIIGNIDNMNNNDMLSQMMYGLFYHTMVNNNNLMKNLPGMSSNKFTEMVTNMTTQTRIINSLFTNVFKNQYDFTKSPKLKNRFEILNSLHVIHNLWDEDPYEYMPDMSGNLGFKYTNNYLKSIIRNYNDNEWLQLLSDQVFMGHIDPQQIRDTIINQFNPQIYSALEDISRFDPIFATVIINDYNGNIKDLISKDFLFDTLRKMVYNLFNNSGIINKWNDIKRNASRLAGGWLPPINRGNI